MNPAGTVGTLLMEDTVTATGSVFGWTIAGTALQTLTFDNTGATAATITVRNNTNAATGLVGGNMVISAPIVLNDDLIVNVADLGSFLTISGTINGGGKTLSILGLGGATIGTAAITNLAGVTIGSVHRATTISGSNTRTGSGEGYALNVSNLAGVTHSGAVTLNAGNINIAAENYGTLTMSGALTTSGNLTITGTGGLSKSVYTDNPTRSNTVAEKSLVRLTAVNALTGNTSISGASVLLSFTANNTANGRLSSAGTLTLGNAGLVMDGNVAASSSQAVTGTTLTDRSGNFVIVNRGNAGPSLGAVNATLNLGTITPGVESSVNFLTVSGTNGSGTTGGALIKVSNPNTNNMLGPWATTGTPGTIGGNVLNWAAKDGSGNVVDATYTTTTTTTFAGVNDATQNTNWTSTDTAVITLSGNITANSLKLATSRNSVSGVNLGTNTITLTSGGLILTNVSANPPASTLPYATWALTRLDNTSMTIQTSGSGLISAATPGTPLYIYANRPTYLSNPVVGDATGRLVKGGSGSLFLSAASTMAGVTIVGGELVLTGAATLATGNLSLNNGGTLIQEGTLTRNIGSASGQVSIGVGGGGFAATANGLTLNLTGTGTGGALTRTDVGGNLIVTNFHSASGVTGLTSTLDTTGGFILGVGGNDSSGVGTYSNSGSALAVVSGATSGSGMLTLLGPTSHNRSGSTNGAIFGGGLIVLNGALSHTGGLQVIGTNVFLGEANASYLANTQVNFNAGATLGTSGTQNFEIGNAPGKISFGTLAGGSDVADAGGFAAIGGVLNLTLNGGVPLNFTSPASNPYHLHNLVLGSAHATHETRLTNELTGPVALSVMGAPAVRVQGNLTGTTVTANLAAGVLVLEGTNNTYTGNLAPSGAGVLRIGHGSAFGGAGAKTISSTGLTILDLNGFSNSSTAHSWTVGGNSSLGNIVNTNTSTTSTVAGNVTLTGFGSEAQISVGGPGNIIFTGAIRNGADASGSHINFRGSGTFTVSGDFDNQAITTAKNTNVYGSTVVFDNTGSFNTPLGTERLITNLGTSRLHLHNGATFRLDGNNSANTIQTVGNSGTAFDGPGNVVEVRSGTGVGQVTTLNLGALARGGVTGIGNGTVNFIETNQGSGTANITTVSQNWGSIATIPILNGGSGYLVAPAVTITAVGGVGASATATATISGGAVTSITVVNPGGGYINPAAITIAAPTGASPVTATASSTLTASTPFLGSWATYGRTTYASVVGGNIEGLPNASYNTSAFTNATITDITSTSNSIGAGTTTSVAMRFNTTATPTLSLTGTLAQAAAPLGILITDAVNTPTSITGGIISATEIVIHQYEPDHAFTIGSQLSSAAARVVVAGPGRVILTNGTNNAATAATVDQGTLEIATANALGTGAGTITLSSGATLLYTGNTDYNRTPSGTGDGRVFLQGNASILNNGTGTLLTLASNSGNAGTVSPAAFVIETAYGYDLTVGGSGNTNIAGIQIGAAAIIEGYGRLIKTGVGTVTLTQQNLIQGGIDIHQGTLAVNSVGAIQAWTPVNINGGTWNNASALMKQGGNIDLTSGDITSTGGGSFTIQALNAKNTSGTSVVSASLGGDLAAVHKTEAGTLVFSNTNTYGGTTKVSGGALQVGSVGVGTTGTGAVSVQNGGTILGTGIVRGGTFTADNGSTLRPGDGVADSSHGTLTFTPASASGSTSSLQGSIILGISGATTTDATYGGNALGSAGYNAWLDGITGVGTHDRLSFTNPGSGTGYNVNFLTTTGSLQVAGSGFVPQDGQVFNLLDWSNLVTTNFTGFNFNSGYLTGNNDEGADLNLPDISSFGLLWDFSRFTASGNIAVVSIVPEPSRALLLMLGLVGLMTRRRRSRSLSSLPL
jgi:autotransporter-associated beta strand protein